MILDARAVVLVLLSQVEYSVRMHAMGDLVAYAKRVCKGTNVITGVFHEDTGWTVDLYDNMFYHKVNCGLKVHATT